MLNERSMAVHVPAFTCDPTVYLVSCCEIHLPGSVAHFILSMEIHDSLKVRKRGLKSEEGAKMRMGRIKTCVNDQRKT